MEMNGGCTEINEKCTEMSGRETGMNGMETGMNGMEMECLGSNGGSTEGWDILLSQWNGVMEVWIRGMGF